MTEITVPRLNANDSSYHLVEWLCADGDRVLAGDPVAVVETSKAAEEIVSSVGGVLHRVVSGPRELTVGEVIGLIFGSEDERQRFLAPEARLAAPAPAREVGTPMVGTAGDTLVTAPALKLAAELGIDPARLRSLGRKVVRRPDVAALADGDVSVASRPAGVPVPDSGYLTLPRSQAAVGATVSRSHATIPAAFTVMKVAVDAALAYGRAATRGSGALIGLPEIFIAAIGRSRSQFPLLFAAPVDELTVRLGPADVGVTIDVGSGLYVPVVRNADRRSPADIAGTVMQYRLTAMRGAFAERDLCGAGILLSLATDDDVLFTQPFVAPGQVCALSIGGLHQETTGPAVAGQFAPPAGGDGGEPRARTVVHLGVSYDHRYVNGNDAVWFLRTVKAFVERPADLDADRRLAAEGNNPS